jgi:uncharacterized protein (TIGR03067 family)
MFTISVLAASLLATVSTAQKDSAKDADKLQGSWSSTTVVTEGVAVPADQLKKAPRTLVVQGDQFTLKSGENKLVGAFRLDPTKSPRTVDLVLTEGPDKGRTVQGIYELDGDHLRVCYDPTGKSRPADFSTKDRPGCVTIEFGRTAKP